MASHLSIRDPWGRSLVRTITAPPGAAPSPVPAPAPGAGAPDSATPRAASSDAGAAAAAGSNSNSPPLTGAGNGGAPSYSTLGTGSVATQQEGSTLAPTLLRTTSPASLLSGKLGGASAFSSSSVTGTGTGSPRASSSSAQASAAPAHAARAAPVAVTVATTARRRDEDTTKPIAAAAGADLPLLPASILGGESSAASTAPPPSLPGSAAYALMESALAASSARQSKGRTLERKPAGLVLELPPGPAVEADSDAESEVDRAWRVYMRESVSELQLDALARIGATDLYGAPIAPVPMPASMHDLFSPGMRAVLTRFNIISAN